MGDWIKAENLWILFVIGAALSWGSYVPVLHDGQASLGGGKPAAGAMRAFLCVGLAYFVTAVIIPGILIWWKGVEPLQFNARGFTFSFLGGALGAAGALCIIFSMRSGGTPMYVPPLVFAGAPIVNALVTMAWHPPEVKPGLIFYVGLVMAALGCGLVLYEKGNVEDKSRKLKATQAAVAKERSPAAT
jgi:hypothetical protein